MPLKIAALTVIRMTSSLTTCQTEDRRRRKDRGNIVHQMSRYVRVKEGHAEICKHELRIIWGDYFQAEHLNNSRIYIRPFGML